MKIKKGDNVQIMVGKDRGKKGKILKSDPKSGMVLVEGLNLVKKHRRQRKQNEKGEVVSIPQYLNISKVMLICASCGQPSRTGYKIEGENKARYCKKCKAVISQ